MLGLSVQAVAIGRNKSSVKSPKKIACSRQIFISPGRPPCRNYLDYKVVAVLEENFDEIHTLTMRAEAHAWEYFEREFAGHVSAGGRMNDEHPVGGTAVPIGAAIKPDTI